MIFNFLLLFTCAFAPFLPLILSASHLIFNSKTGKYDEVEDSPYLIMQPHSLDDFLRQIEWVRELSELKANVKQQQEQIERRYDADDPEIERKVRESNEDCIRSRPLDLQNEYFQTDYSVSLVHVKRMSDGESLPMQVRPATEWLNSILDTENIPEAEGEAPEPDCEHLPAELAGLTVSSTIGAIDPNRFEDVEEPGLAPEWGDPQLNTFAHFLARRFRSEHPQLRHLTLYLAHFYWRIRGRSRMALKCLLKFLALKPPENHAPAKFQLGMMLVKLGDSSRAIELLEETASHVPDCGVCLMPLGDAYVLNGNFREAIKTFDHAFALDSSLEMAEKKASLLRCTDKLVEVMENQHSNLLDTIKDVEDFKEKMRRIQELEVLIERNRAPAEARLQAKLAFEHLEYGPLPHSNCREGVQWVKGGKQRKRLYCTVSSWHKYNESLSQRKQEKAAQKAKQAKPDPEKEKERRERVERRKAKEAEWEQNAKEMEQYLERLAPFVGMTMDEPQLRAKYPLEKLPDLMTKFLALGPDEHTPLPWELPHCEAAIIGERELDRKFKFIQQLDIFTRLKELPPSHKRAELKLKPELHKLVGFEANEEDFTQEPPMLAELGARIGNLMKFGIGPKWISLNLAALYFRLLGIPAEAVKCLESALKFPEHQDIALTQLAQIMMQNLEDVGNQYNQQELDGIERILSIALQEGIQEPLPYYLFAIFHSIRGRWQMVEGLLLQTLQRDPQFKPAMEMLLNRRCVRRMEAKVRQLRELNAPICCWPNEQEVYCFEERLKKNSKGKRRKRTRCFRLEAELEEPYQVQAVYYRCNTPYTGKSYSVPPMAKVFFIPLLKPIIGLRQQREEQLQRQFEAEVDAKWGNEEPEEVPVFPLDYGGYSLERIQQHQRRLWPEGVSGPEDLVREYIDPAYLEEKQKRQEVAQGNESSSMGQQMEDGSDGISQGEKEEKMQQKPIELDGADIGKLQSRTEVVHRFDIPLPEKLPMPPKEMIKKGKGEATAMKHAKLTEVCQQAQKKSMQLLEQPVSTWVSPTAKGIKIEDLVDLDVPMPSISGAEPVCPDPKMDKLSDSNLLLELDKLPAYTYRQHLSKFYKPEKALKDTFRTIGTSQMDKIEQVATRLHFAIKAAHSTDHIHWALSTLASLYWRVKGDPVNAIQCLRHSLHTSPEKFKDVPLVSLANIYHQAGFLHSALFTLGKALETGKDVVAIHFTLANLYATIGDFPHALHFYHSTLALQANFEPAKVRIVSIHCLTNGKHLDAEE